MIQSAIVKKQVREGVVEVSLLRQVECGLSCGGNSAGHSIGQSMLVFALPCVFLVLG